MKRSKRWFNKRMNISDNKGSAIVMVLVIIAFVSILASIMCYRAILNYQMKVVDYNSKDNFYSAEGALDEIRTGLQTIASEAVGESYIEVMQTYHNYSNEERAKQFTYLYMEKLKAKLKDGTDESHYKLSVLESYLTNPVVPGSSVGAKVEAAVANGNKMVPYTQGLVLENVKVTYTDAQDYISIIETDIQFFLPKIDFNEAFRLPDILQYCMIANKGVDVTASNSKIEGSVYAGENGIVVKDSARLEFINSELVVTDGSLEVANGSAMKITGDAWANNIVVNSHSDISLNGNIYVGDDTTVGGNECKVTYKGSYYGFGQDQSGVGGTSGGSVGSSAILVNGPDTTLDFSGLTSFTLAGNAYINIYDKGDIPIQIDGSTPEVNIPTTSDVDNVLMGESVAVKSDQLAYLVPPECIGYKGDECIIGTNPVSRERLEAFNIQKANAASDEERALFKEVKLDKISSLGKSLNDYHASVKKLYHRLPGEATSQLVYYYMEFEKQADANAFFRDYYSAHKDKVDTYVSHYIREINLGNFGSMNVNLAGNMLYKDSNGVYQLESDNLNENLADEEYINSLTYYKNTYTALCTKLVKDKTDITLEEETKKLGGGLYTNIIDEKVYTDSSYSLAYPSDCYTGGNRIQFGDSTDYYGLFVNVPSYTINVSPSDKLRVVVATGDVIVQSDFTGIIIAKGNIILQNNVQLKSDPAGVSAALQKNCTVHSNSSHYCVNLFLEGHALAVSSTEGSGGSGETVEIEDLIGYRNWSKQ